MNLIEQLILESKDTNKSQKKVTKKRVNESIKPVNTWMAGTSNGNSWKAGFDFDTDDEKEIETWVKEFSDHLGVSYNIIDIDGNSDGTTRCKVTFTNKSKTESVKLKEDITLNTSFDDIYDKVFWAYDRIVNACLAKEGIDPDVEVPVTQNTFGKMQSVDEAIYNFAKFIENFVKSAVRG